MMGVLYDYLDTMFIDNSNGVNSDSALQLLPLGIVINPKDFENAVSAVNFDEGSLNTAENFAQLVNDVPLAQTKFVSQGKIDDVYKWILDNTVPLVESEIPEDRKKLYDSAFGLLYRSVQNDGNNAYVPSEKLVGYNDALAEYEKKISERSKASLDADHTTPKGQKKWSLEKRELDSAIKTASNKLAAYEEVKKALNIVKTTFSAGIRGVVAKEKEFFEETELESDTGKKWHMCSAFPSNWYENESMFTQVTMNASSMKDDKMSKHLKVAAETSMQMGIFSGSASGGYNKDEEHGNAKIENISMKIAAVRIDRPWLNETLFKLDGWKIDGCNKGHISDGTFVTTEGGKVRRNEGVMPLLPKYMLIAKDVVLSGKIDSAVQD